jgi:signal transduction histidine kinase
VVALVSLPLARGIARPLEAVAEAARRLGRGDLGARSGLQGPGEIASLGSTFDEMAERLERLLTAQRQLLADVSHELRTPLARMRVSLALARDAPPTEVARHLEALEGDAVELESLVGDLLTGSRLDSGGALVLRREPVDLGAVARAAADRLERLYPGRRLVVSIEASPTVAGEPALLARVLDNLLDNAARYSDGPVGLSVSPGSDGVLVVVRDEGQGLAPDDEARAFTPFFRTDASRARHTGGAGLGLWLCQRIVQAHGGRIELLSRPGEGTRVLLLIPA